MNTGNKYKLIGILNMFDVIPEFVYPVFENDGKYFIQDRTCRSKINSFELLTNDNFINSVVPFYDYKLTFSNRKFDFYEGDDILIGFQLNESELFLGSFEDFKEYAKDLELEDEFMQIEIPYFISECEEKKLTKKGLE